MSAQIISLHSRKVASEPPPCQSGLTAAQKQQAIRVLRAFAADMGLAVTITVH
jgi:hypothetical protein